MGLRWVESRQSSPQPDFLEPEQVFFNWLMVQSVDETLLAAASREAARLARYTGPHDGPRKLARMFAELIEHLEKPKRRGSRVKTTTNPDGSLLV